MLYFINFIVTHDSLPKIIFLSSFLPQEKIVILKSIIWNDLKVTSFLYRAGCVKFQSVFMKYDAFLGVWLNFLSNSFLKFDQDACLANKIQP